MKDFLKKLLIGTMAAAMAVTPLSGMAFASEADAVPAEEAVFLEEAAADVEAVDAADAWETGREEAGEDEAPDIEAVAAEAEEDTADYGEDIVAEEPAGEAEWEAVPEDEGSGLYTVTLAECENGTVAFEDEGIEGLAAEFAEGDEVAVTITPDEGYIFTKITLFYTDDGEIAAEDDEPEAEGYSFAMPAEDITVSVEFAEDDSVSVSDGLQTDAALENYILANLDESLTGPADGITLANGLVVKNTMFDGTVMESGDTLMNVMRGVEGGDLTQMQKFLMQIETLVAVYDVNEDSPYYVASANTMANEASVWDAVFALNDNDGNNVDGCIYDYGTGLAYIPKSLYRDSDGGLVLGRIQVQLMQVIGGNWTSASSEVMSSTVEGDDEEVSVYHSLENIFDFETTVKVDAGLDPYDIAVFVNGIPTTDYSYDPASGTVTVDQSSAVVQSVSVQTDTDEAVMALSSGIATYSLADNMKYYNKSTIELPAGMQVGDVVSGTVPVNYIGTYETGVYVYYAGLDYSNGSLNALYNYIRYGDNGKSLDEEYDAVYRNNYIDFCYNFNATDDTTFSGITSTGDTIYIDFSKLGYAYMGCGHVSDPQGGSAGFQSYSDCTVMARLLYLDDDSAVFGLIGGADRQANSYGLYQAAVGLVKLHVTQPDTGYLKLHKDSGDPSITDGNSYYDLSGATYRIYYDEECENRAANADGSLSKAVLTTDENGDTNTVEMNPGIYYVREQEPPTNYERDRNVYEVEVTAENTADYPVVLNVVDYPSTGELTLIKSSSNSSITDGNSCYDMTGITFNVYDSKGNSAGQLVCKADGTTNTLTLGAGTYTVEEDKDSLEGTGYDMGTNSSGKSSPWTVTVSVGNTATLKVSDPPLNDPAGITIYKENGSKSGTGAPLAGAEFTIKYYDGYYSSVSSLPSTATRTWVIQTKAGSNGTYIAGLSDTYKVSGDAWYYDEDGRIVLPLGTITIEETKAPEGYSLNGTFEDSEGNKYAAGATYIAQTTGTGTAVSTSGGNVLTVGDPDIRGGVQIVKGNIDSGDQTLEGDITTFAGATFEITNNNSYDVYVNGKTYSKGEVVATIVADSDGVAKTDKDTLPFGSYTITETIAPDGMLVEGTGLTQSFSITENNVIKELTQLALDTPMRGGVMVQKRDAQSGSTDPSGGASFANITLQITNNSANRVLVEGKWYEPGEIVKTLVTDDDGFATTAADTLPYGSYTIAEVDVPSTDGYLLGSDTHDSVSSTTSIPFTIDEDNAGTVVDLTGKDESVTDLVKRGDIALTKHNEETQEAMSVPFAVTSLTTGESHVFWTDENGDYSSDSTWNKHSYHTDAGETPDDGLWFYGYADEEESGVEVDDSLGALPYDTYALDELPCDANEGMELVHTTFTVTRDVRVIDLGQYYNTPEEVPEPYLHTMAYAGDTGTQLCNADDGYVTLYDICYYYNLTPGMEYHLYGVALDTETREPELDHYGNKICAVTTFTPEEADGIEIQEFYFDVEDLSGHKVTFFETIYYLDEDGNAVFVVAEDPEDYEVQSIYFPQVGTTLLDAESGTHYSVAGDEVTLTDTVSVREVPEGTVVMVTGTLMSKDTGEPVIGSDGYPVTASTTYTSTGIAEQLVEITFTFDASELDGKGVVAFEELYQILDVEEETGPLVGEHKDIDDEGQTVNFPGIHTTATDSQTGNHTGVESGTATIVDVVDYTGLVPGEEYTVSGVLMDKATGEELVDSKGNTVTAEKTFVPESADGSVELEFTFDSSLLGGTTVVVFEDAYNEGKLVATHADINDLDQTVDIPGVHTTATDRDNGTHTSDAYEETVILDEVEYTGLTPGEEYTISGVLMNQATGEELIDSKGNTVTSELTFVPEKADGSVTLEFEVDTSALAGATIVVFEDLMYNGIPIATHSDITDVAQSVDVPEIGTTATDAADGDKSIAAGQATIDDEVTYEGLEPGRTYVMVGTVMDASTGEAVIVNGGTVTNQVEFVPEESSGSVIVPLEIDASALAGKNLVVYEKAYVLSDDGTYYEVARHEDLSDEGQTVSVVTTVTTTGGGGGIVTTGESHMGLIIGIIGCCAAAAIVIVVLATRRSRKRKAA